MEVTATTEKNCSNCFYFGGTGYYRKGWCKLIDMHVATPEETACKYFITPDDQQKKDGCWEESDDNNNQNNTEEQ